MSWDAIGAMGQALGSVAVLVTLIYLAMQTRHAREERHRAIVQGRADSLRELWMARATDTRLISRIIIYQRTGRTN